MEIENMGYKEAVQALIGANVDKTPEAVMQRKQLVARASEIAISEFVATQEATQ